MKPCPQVTIRLISKDEIAPLKEQFPRYNVSKFSHIIECGEVAYVSTSWWNVKNDNLIIAHLRLSYVLKDIDFFEKFHQNQFQRI